MADNVTINDADAAEQVVATDDVGGAHYQIVKLGFGTNGAAILASSDNPLPVTLSGGGSSGTQYNEDAAHASGDTGTMALGVRRDTPTATAADGDYVPLIVDSSGRLHVQFGNTTIAVTNAGTFATQVDGDALTALQLLDDTVATDGAAAATKLLQVGGTDGTNAQILSVDSSGRAYVNVFNTVTVTGTGGTFPVTDSGGSLTIDAPVATPAFVRLSDGTDPITTLPVSLASVPSHAVTNAGTFAVQVSSALAAGDNNIGNVDIVTVPSDPFGANADAASATGSISAKLRFIASTGIPVTGTVTVGSHAVTNAGTFVVQVDGSALTALSAIQTAVEIIDNAISGNEMQVDIVGAIPAGTNNIGDVDVLSIIPGTGATNLGKAIDTATGATDTGVLALATRDDALSALTPIEGDNVQLRTDANGALWVIPSGTITVASHAVTNAGTFAVQVDGAALTALQLIDDVVFTDDAAFTPATSKVLATGFIVDETTPDSLDEGDIGAARMTADRSQYVCTIPISGYVYENGIRLEVKRAIIDAASSGDNTLLAAVTNKKIRVLSMFMVAAGTVNVRIESGASGTALSGQMNLVANTGFVLPHNPDGWFQTAESTLLNMELSAAVSVDGAFTYVEAE